MNIHKNNAYRIQFSQKNSSQNHAPFPTRPGTNVSVFVFKTLKAGNSVASNTQRSHYIKMHYLFKFYHIPPAAKRSHRRNLKQPVASSK